MEKGRKTAIVVGGGLVGSLVAVMLVKRGYLVKVYEMRDDYRLVDIPRGKSINLALSHRGRKALKYIGLERNILSSGVPMYGRLLHSQKGETKSVPYDPVSNKCLYSISRNDLNTKLIEELSKYNSCELYFNHKLIDINLEKGQTTFENTKTQAITHSEADFIIAADGAFSKVRYVLQKLSLLNFSQTFIDTAYVELTIGAEQGKNMIKNHLHIWPRGGFMMIALPNEDETWTVTLFMPLEKFKSLDSDAKVLQFFEDMFPDYLEMVDRQVLLEEFSNRSPAPLVMVKCDPYHYGGKFLLIGDAAHAMVPFFGQGMNAGFEDCTLLSEILDETEDDVEKSIALFTEKRKEDAHLICDMAMYNYLEMRNLVTKKIFILRKYLDSVLYKIFGSNWTPFYHSVTFTSMQYSQCVKNKQYQDKVILLFILFALALFLFILCFKFGGF